MDPDHLGVGPHRDVHARCFVRGVVRVVLKADDAGRKLGEHGLELNPYVVAMDGAVWTKRQVLVAEGMCATPACVTSYAVEQPEVHRLERGERDRPHPPSVCVVDERMQLVRELFVLDIGVDADVVVDVLDRHRRRIHALASTLSIRSLAITSLATRSGSALGGALLARRTWRSRA